MMVSLRSVRVSSPQYQWPMEDSKKTLPSRIHQPRPRQSVFSGYDYSKGRGVPRSVVFNVAILLLYTSILCVLLSQRSGNLQAQLLGQDGSGRCSFTTPGVCDGRGGRKAGPEIADRLTYSEILWRRVVSHRVTSEDYNELKAASAIFNTSDPKLEQVVKLVKEYLTPWAPMPGITDGLGSKGGWSVNLTRAAAVNTNLMACCMHVRVVDGLVYFRYGRFLMQHYRVKRANDFVKFLQNTVDRYALKGLRSEFLFNTCDHPLSDGSFMRGGASRHSYMVWSNHFTEGHTDLLVPDFLDLGQEYMPAKNASQVTVEWEDKNVTAVFRGGTTNYNIQCHNWVSSPRLRLHRLTDAYPHLLDARISKWSHVLDFEMRHEMRREGIVAAPRMEFGLKDAFKYEVVMDGGLGTTRPCGVLMNDRVLVRQSSPFYQFFDPLFRPGRHFIPVDHNLGNLAERLAYMQSHDAEMKEMAWRSKEELGWTCTEEGRMLAFAVLLVKNDGAVRDSEQVQKPTKMCQWGALKEALQDLPNDRALDCMDQENTILPLPGCPTPCSAFGLHERDWHWLTYHDVEEAVSTT